MIEVNRDQGIFMDRELRQLIKAVFESPQDELALEKLNARLEQNPAECAEYLEYCQLHGDLVFTIASENAEQQALHELGAATLFPAPRSGRQSISQSAKRSLLFLAGIAASLLVWFGWQSPQGEVVYQEGLRQPTIVASVVSAEDATWASKEYTPGESLRIGSRLELAKGIVKVNMPTGAELVLQGPCKLVLQSPERVVLQEGKVTAHVAEWATGFAVETASL
jgi:hypothetical protein